MKQKPTIRRGEAATILAVAMLKLRKLGDTSDWMDSEAEQPVWLIELRRELRAVVEKHLPHEFGVDYAEK